MIRDYSAYIVNDKNQVEDLLKVLPLHSYVYFITNDEKFNNQKVIEVKNINQRTVAYSIYKDSFEKRLGWIWTDKSLKALNDQINTFIQFEKNFTFTGGVMNWIKNLWNNLPYIVNTPNSTILKSAAKGRPLVIVSSGPSLNKNIHILKEYQDKCFIMCCSTAIGALKKHEITPDFLITVDPDPCMKELIKPFLDEKTVLIAPVMADNGLVESHNGPKIFFYTDDAVKIAGDIGCFLDIKETFLLNLSVATSAFHLALFMEAEQIIFIGQDLCLSENDLYYADGVKGTEVKSNCEVVGLNGKTYNTTQTLKDVSDYFNQSVLMQKRRTIINATEGGVGITGAEHMALKDVAEKYFLESISEFKIKGNVVIDKAKILAKIALIKNETEELIKFAKLFKRYTESLFDAKVPYDFIKTEIDEWFDNLRAKSGYQYLSTFMDWVWYMLIVSETENQKKNAINILLNQLDTLHDLIEKQISELSKQILT